MLVWMVSFSAGRSALLRETTIQREKAWPRAPLSPMCLAMGIASQVPIPSPSPSHPRQGSWDPCKMIGQLPSGCGWRPLRKGSSRRIGTQDDPCTVMSWMSWELLPSQRPTIPVPSSLTVGVSRLLHFEAFSLLLEDNNMITRPRLPEIQNQQPASLIASCRRLRHGIVWNRTHGSSRSPP